MTNMFFQILSTNIYTTLFSILFKSLIVNMTCVWKEDCRLTFINEAEKANIQILQQTIEAEYQTRKALKIQKMNVFITFDCKNSVKSGT